MKFKKTISSILLIICMCFMLTYSVYAEDTTISDTTQNPSTFADLCNDYFTNKDLYTIFDKNNADISDSYYLATIDWYQNNNISSIWDYTSKNVSCMDKTEPIGNSNARGALQTVKKTITFYDVVYNTNMNDFEIAYTLSGKFTYNANTGLVTSYSSPSVTLTHVGISGNISATMTDVSTNATLTSEGYGVKFSCRFNILSTLTYSIGIINYVVAEDITGPYTNSFIAYGS